MSVYYSVNESSNKPK